VEPLHRGFHSLNLGSKNSSTWNIFFATAGQLDRRDIEEMAFRAQNTSPDCRTILEWSWIAVGIKMFHVEHFSLERRHVEISSRAMPRFSSHLPQSLSRRHT